MATPSQQQQQEEWLPKKEAAELLGVSTRQIERYAESGRVRMKLARLEGDRSDRNIYSTEDLVRIRTDREAGTVQMTTRSLPQLALESSPILTALVTALRPPASRDIWSKPWLTMDEAAEYSGLTVRQIRKLDKGAAIRGWGSSSSRRISKASIDAFSAEPLSV